MRVFTSDDLIIDRNQGLDAAERRFGYVHTGHGDDGGFFFTWMPTLDETLDSLDPDDLDPPVFPRGLARDYLEQTIAKHFSGE